MADLAHTRNLVSVDTLNDPGPKPQAERHVHVCDLTKRAWMLALRRNPTHVLFLEDDALLCTNLLPGVLKMLDGPVADQIVTLCGGRKTHEAACSIGARWFRSPDGVVGVAVMMPAYLARDWLMWDRHNVAPDYKYSDGRIALYAYAHHMLIWTPCPSLVGHDDRMQSLLNHHATPGRQMNFFNPAFDASAPDWANGGVVDGHAAPSLYRDLRQSVRDGPALIAQYH
jgi:hypothetical protein